MLSGRNHDIYRKELYSLCWKNWEIRIIFRGKVIFKLYLEQHLKNCQVGYREERKPILNIKLISAHT